MKSFIDVMAERDFISQTTDDGGLKELFDKEKVVAYVGFDATADSLHVGSLLQIIALAHLQKMGHHPIALIGGATTMIGDPSGKTEMRKMLSKDEINENLLKIKKQLERFLDFSPSLSNRAMIVNNADWLTEYKYIDFLRDIGKHFSVNRMLTQDSVKLRMETGISFIEFNYMILQAYDFMHLNKQHNCKVQFGGSDQWGNIVMGIDLVRRMNNEQGYGMTFPLITTSSGKKMGKTESGAVWLDAEKTSPYEFYQFWINTDDKDVIRMMKYYTFFTMEEISEFAKLEGADLRTAKKALALHITELVHGKDEAFKARESSEATFEGKGAIDKMPSFQIAEAELFTLSYADLFMKAELCTSKGNARKLAEQGGAYLNNEKLSDANLKVKKEDLKEGAIILRAGKKNYCRVILF